jgi:PhnB protein
MTIPQGYQTVMPYLILENAEQFLSFAENVFGAKEKVKHLNSAGTIMHAEVQISDSTIMFANATEEFPVQTSGLYIHVTDADQSYQKALESGATPIMAPRDQDYGRSGGIVDPCGNTWWITTPINAQPF